MSAQDDEDCPESEESEMIIFTIIVTIEVGG